MIRKLWFILSLMVVILLSGCGGGGGSTATASANGAGGAGQKGPFVLGSTVTAYKLASNGSRSATTASTTTTDSLGTYSFSSLGWTGATELEISGNYFNENNGSTSATSSLSAIVDVISGQTISANINILTNLAAQRTVALMQAGSALATARTQAQATVVDLFDLNLSAGVELEDLDLTVGSGTNAQANADLLRISAALAAQPSILAGLEAAIADGNVTNDSNGSATFATLAQAVNDVNMTAVSNNLEQNLSVSDVPDANDTDANASFASNAHAPVITTVATQNKQEDDGAFDISLSATDGDGDTVTFLNATSSDVSKATVSLSGTTLTITPVANANGTVAITVTASDGTLLDTEIFTLNIASVNDAPVLSALSNQTKNEDASAFTLILSASDVEGDTITYDANSSDTSVAIVSVSGTTLTITPQPNANGAVIINVSANDGNGGVDTTSFTLTLNPQNDAPVLSSINNIVKDEDSNDFLAATASATDVDGDSITYTFTSLDTSKATVYIGFFNELRVVPVANANGDVDFTLTASDGNGGVDTTSFTLTLTPVNDAPTITTNGGIDYSLDVAEGTTAVTTITATDIDGDTGLRYYVGDNAADYEKFQIDINSGELTFKVAPDFETILDHDANNIYDVQVYVRDPSGDSASTDFIVHVTVTDIPEVSGDATDARVSGALVEVYNSIHMLPNDLVGSGTTSSTGAFDIVLTSSSIPSPLYFKTIGGLNIDTNMTAPTMQFVGDVASDGKYHISPISSTIIQRMLGGEDLGTAQTNALNAINGAIGTSMNFTDLSADPLSDSNLTGSISSILASGIPEVVLEDGNYSITALTFSQGEIGNAINGIDDLTGSTYLKQLQINISSGYVTGTIAGYGRIVGATSGSTIYFNIIPDDNSSVTKISGTLGIYGSCTGTFVDYDNNGYSARGVFAAQIVRSTGVNYQAMATGVANSLMGPNTFIFRDYLSPDGGANIGYGDVNITSYNGSNHTFTASNLMAYSEENSTASGEMPFGMNFNNAKMLQVDGHPTSIAMIRYDLNATEQVYMIKPVGVRSGIFVLTSGAGHNISSIGDAIFNRSNVVAPSLTSGNKNIYVNVLTPDLLGKDKSEILDANHSFTMSMSIPAAIDSLQGTASFNAPDDTKMIVGGSTVAIYQDSDGDFDGPGDFEDYIRIMQLFDSGAFQGEHINGGSFPDGSGGWIPLRTSPMPFVGAIRDGSVNPYQFNGTLNFITRTLYIDSDDFDTFTVFNTGTLTIDGNNCSLTTTITQDGVVPNPANNTYSMTADFNTTTGIYHIYGGDIDIIWAVGAPKALYTVTYDTNDSIESMGDAFLSY